MYSYLFISLSQLPPSLSLGTGEGSQGSNPQSSSARPQVADKRIPLGEGCHVMMQKGRPWIIVGNVFGVFGDYIFPPFPTHHTFSVAVKSCRRG
jgi:hypothetical protein